MKPLASLTHLRQLCCLGLGQTIFMPEFLRTLADAVPSLYSGAVFLDERGNITNLYTEHPTLLEAGREFAIRHANSDDERSAWGNGSLAQFVRVGVLENAWHVDTRMTRSRYYNEVVRPFGIRHQMRARFQTSAGLGGALFVARGVDDGRFRRPDEEVLSAVLPYLRYAVSAPQAIKGATAVSGEGLILLDRTGTIQHLDAGARALLSLAAVGAIAASPTVSRLLVQITDDLHHLWQARETQPPERRHRCAAGEFVFRGRWLNHYRGSSDDIVAVSVQRLVPLTLKAMDTMRTHSLSARQKQLCVGLIAGRSFTEIAHLLGIRQSTVSDYARVVYQKLEVQNREQLKALLLR